MLSTPATQIFEAQPNISTHRELSHLPDEALWINYEVERTLAEIRKERYSRVALQFPDNMLPDAPRVFGALSKGLNPFFQTSHTTGDGSVNPNHLDCGNIGRNPITGQQSHDVKLYILADTSYGACCVDEIAAEHIDADVVVHYGRACLSPTARIPVIHVFTVQPPPDSEILREDFKRSYDDKSQRIILMADVTHQSHLEDIQKALVDSERFENLFLTHVVHDPSSPLPNRTVPDEVKADPSKLKSWHLFHISDPPESLLLTLASRVASIRILPTSHNNQENRHSPFNASTSRALNRRYALLTSVTTVSTFGILINTLSVKNYLYIVEHVKSQIRAAGKKSYTFVVGKVNAAKIANFSEIGAWVVIGCWESSLIDSKDFWKPVLTPFELELALQRDGERVWTGEWSSNFQKILDESKTARSENVGQASDIGSPNRNDGAGQDDDIDSEPESAPPEFDLRNGRYVSNVRPMNYQNTPTVNNDLVSDHSLVKRAKGDMTVMGGDFSPGAAYLRSERTWKGLGSDFKIAYEEEGATIEEGRNGIARGYLHREGGTKT